jgi:mannose-6-phosphate isomerase-like protein (cupin superfamily)
MKDAQEFRDSAHILIPSKSKGRSFKTIGLTLVCLGLAAGWLGRERAFARSANEAVRSATVNLGDVKMSPYSDNGSPVGQLGIYLSGDTAASRKFVTGRLVLDPGKSPHPPHTHLEEEVMIIESGTGDLICDGKTTKVGPGSTMYSAPNVPHGIVNTGSTPIVFYFIKWAHGESK